MLINKKFNKIFKKYINKQDSIILAVSGGVDSMALVDLILKTNLDNKNIHIAHLDHNLRPDSHNDYLFVEAYAKKNNINFIGKKEDVTSYSRKYKKSIEEAARELRYKFLRKARKIYNAKYILTAHHADDIVETILFNIIRGSFLKGMAGMDYIHQDLFRPFVEINKADIHQYAKKNKINFHEDSTNINTTFNRNKLRHNIIPEIKKINPQFKKTLLRSTKLFRETQEFLDEATEMMKINQLNQEVFNKLSPIVLKEIIRKEYQSLYKDTYDLSLNSVEEIQRFISTSHSGTEKEFGDKYTIYNDFGNFRISKNKINNKKIATGRIAFKECKPSFDFMDYKITIKKILPKSIDFKSGLLYIDKNLGGELSVRIWQAGDKFTPLGMKGTKKLQDYFVDNKISVEKRSTTPIFINENNIIVAVGDTVDDFFKITEKTKKAYEVKIV